jgi:Fungal N-terminal domain of STAND proteins
MQGCNVACKEFVEKLTRHSSAGKTRFDDMVRLQFQEKEIMAFKYRIGSDKSTLNIALGMATL